MSETRERILETAAQLLQRQGYCATGLNQVIQESGAPKGSLYHYFPGGKEELAEVAILESGQEFAELLQSAIETAGGAVSGIPQFIRNYARQFEASHYEKGCPIATVTLETASHSEVLQQATQSVFHSWCVLIIDHLLREGWEEQQARETAIFIMSALNGALTMSRAAQRIEPLEITANQLERLLQSMSS